MCSAPPRPPAERPCAPRRRCRTRTPWGRCRARRATTTPSASASHRQGTATRRPKWSCRSRPGPTRARRRVGRPGRGDAPAGSAGPPRAAGEARAACSRAGEFALRSPAGIVCWGRHENPSYGRSPTRLAMTRSECDLLRDDDLMATRAMIETDTEGVIHRWDGGAERLFGYSAVEALGRPVDLIVPEHLRVAHWAGFHRAMHAPVVKNLAAD